MAKKRDYDEKEPGQQFEEIEEAQRVYRRKTRRNRGKGKPKKPRKKIDVIEKSKQRDKEELRKLGNDARKNRPQQ
jgi:hypothetical protein